MALLGDIAEKKIDDIKFIKNERAYKWEISWPNVMALSALHLFAIYGWYLKFYCSWSHIIFYKTVGVLSTWGVTGGAHRLWAHRCYRANTCAQIILACMMSMTYQNSIYVWCRDHRVHHKFTETDADPHNAKRGFFFSHMGWLLVRKHKDVKEKGKTLDLSDLEANPVVMFQHKYYYFIIFLMGLIIPTFLPWYLWDEPLVQTFFTGVAYRYIVTVHLTWCINSVAHLYGKKPFNKHIGPTESPIMMILGQGEGFHNYHHTFPSDYKAAELGNDFRNPTTMLIDLFAWLGWVTDRKTVSKETILNRITRTGDGTHSMTIKDINQILNAPPRTHKDNIKQTLIMIIVVCILT